MRAYPTSISMGPPKQWFCDDCGHGPMTSGIDDHCVSCGKRKGRNAARNQAPDSTSALELPSSLSLRCSLWGYFQLLTFPVFTGKLSFHCPQDEEEPYSSVITSSRPLAPLTTFGSKGSKRWFCCSCGDGPKALAVEPACASCGHRPCSGCTIK